MLAVIGGSGLNQLSEFTIHQQVQLETPFGEAAVIRQGRYPHQSNDMLFIPRHGEGHALPPHKINYQANLWALKELGASHVLGVNAVGGIRADMAPGRLVIPDQIIDYTFGREHTYFNGDASGVEHIDFTEPYDTAWRQTVLNIAKTEGIAVIYDGTYGCSQGPRLETAAEIRRMRTDGCDVVGMTGMPEAALARELNLKYCAVNLVVNWGAGLGSEAITMASITAVLEQGMVTVTALIQALALKFTPAE